MRFFYGFIICVFTLLVACNPSGKLVKQGDAKRNNGFHEDASTYYYNALLRNPKDQKAKDGLAISAQQVLDEKFTGFNKLVVENNVNEAMKAYKNAERYSQTASSVGVQLRWPTEYDDIYLDIRSEYISGQYDEALKLMNNREYERAEKIFERIAELDTTYRGITVLRINTVLEPLYQHGMQEMEQGKFKQAYQTFSKIVQQDEAYKDAKAMKEEANLKATTTLAVFPVYVVSEDSSLLSSQLTQLIHSRLMQKKFDYVLLQQPDEVAQTLRNRGWESIPSVEQAVEAGKTIGIKYVVWVKIESVKYIETPVTTEQKAAYEAFSENILNPYTGTYSAITKFRKVMYDDTNEKRALTVKYTYALLNSQDGKTMLSEQKEFTQKDEIHQFVYNGNINNLYEELPNGNYLPPANQGWRDLFTNAKRTALRKEQLLSEANFNIARQISQSVLGFFK